jgi:flagellar assembly factor FliW
MIMQRYSGVSNTAAIASGAILSAGMPRSETIQSRFGEIVVDVDRAVAFPNGPLGMPDKNNFVLANFSSPKMEQFTLLQSLDDSQLSFITLPLEMSNSIVAEADIRDAADDLQIKHDDLAMFLIVSVHRSPDKVRLSVNTRAPLFMDVRRKLGAQYVFQNDKYKVQHML